MAILMASERQKRRMLAVLSKDGHSERYDAREDARAIHSLARRLERPRYEELEPAFDPTLVMTVVLVFDNPDSAPYAVTIPPLDQVAPPPLIMAPPQTEEKRAMREQRRAALRAELADLIRAAGNRGFLIVGEGLDDDPLDEGTVDAKGERVYVNAEGKRVHATDPDAREPLIDNEEGALAAYRELVRSCRDHGPLQVWAVVTIEDGQRVRRVYIGREGALRRNFPDLEELERMRAAGITGAATFNYHGPAGLLDGLGPDAVRDALPRLAAGFLEAAGHELPPAPVRIQRLRYEEA